MEHLELFESGKTKMTEAKPMFLQATTKKEAEKAIYMFREGINLLQKAYVETVDMKFKTIYNQWIGKEESYLTKMEFLKSYGKKPD